MSLEPNARQLLASRLGLKGIWGLLSANQIAVIVGALVALAALSFALGFWTSSNTSQLWPTIHKVELTTPPGVRLVVSVDGVPYISYPAREVWSDGRTSERFPLPMDRFRYTLQFEATLFDGTRTIVAGTSESVAIDRFTAPITRRYIRLYPTDSETGGRNAVARLLFSVGTRWPSPAEADRSSEMMAMRSQTLFFSVIGFAVISPFIYIFSGSIRIRRLILPVGLLLFAAYHLAAAEPFTPISIMFHMLTIYPAMAVILIVGIPGWLPQKNENTGSNEK